MTGQGGNVIADFISSIFAKSFLYSPPRFWGFNVSPPLDKKIRKYKGLQGPNSRAKENNPFKKLGFFISIKSIFYSIEAMKFRKVNI